jgi:hypothetical protein
VLSGVAVFVMIRSCSGAKALEGNGVDNRKKPISMKTERFAVIENTPKYRPGESISVSALILSHFYCFYVKGKTDGLYDIIKNTEKKPLFGAFS